MAGQGRRRQARAHPLEIDILAVKAGDRVIFKTAGSGGRGDPLDRDAEKVARDVRYDLVSAEKAKSIMASC